MRLLALILGLFFIFAVFLDAFQTIILPRRPKGRFRITRMFFLLTWAPWAALAGRFKDPRIRDQAYSIFGPLSLLLLLVVWATVLVGGYGLILFALGSSFHDNYVTHTTLASHLLTDFYVSGTSLFTLGLGDVTPEGQLTRAVLVIESATGLGFVALVIGYIPVLYQTFSRREVSVALLDGRAGSPPAAAELLRRHSYPGGDVVLVQLLLEWERWSAEVLESHVSYPILCYYRSQHDNQNWLAALVAILDSCALLITVLEGEPVRQAQLTFAMARHAVIDLGHIFSLKHQEPQAATIDRLSTETFHQLCDALGDTHLTLCANEDARERLTKIRALYEPHAEVLARFLCLSLPLWVAEPRKSDAWKTVADLSSSPEGALRATGHVSERSLASHLHDEDHVI